MRPEPMRRLYRSRDHRMLTGVAGGIAEYLGIDPTVVRALWVIAAVLPVTSPGAIVLYVLLLLVIPEEPVAS